jgi:hypothetical protein
MCQVIFRPRKREFLPYGAEETARDERILGADRRSTPGGNRPVTATLILVMIAMTVQAQAASVTVDVNSMPRVVFTGDSQTCGRVGAWDYPQMLSWEIPIRVINTGVGGTNTDHLLVDLGDGNAEVKAGEMKITGANVSWVSGPYPGQKIRLGEQEYTIDHVEVVDYHERLHNIWITEPAREDFAGDDFAVEPGWQVRVADLKPDYACFMYTVNDAGSASEVFTERIEDLLRRCEELGAQPILLSGFPLMDDERGGSHPGHNPISTRRPEDLQAIAEEYDVPYGDVFRTLLALDEQSTSVWRDTVHPTTDGSTAAMTALRYIFEGLGLADNPYYVRGARPGHSAAPGPFTISQPDHSAEGKPDENKFDLEAIRLREEYGLLAEEDGQCVEGAPGLHLWFGVGELEAIERLTIRVVVTGADRLKYFDRSKSQWLGLATGDGELIATLKGETLAKAWQDGEIGLWIAGPEKVAVDYASVTIEGDVAAWEPTRSAEPIVWPPASDLIWEGGGLIVNGSVSEGDTAAPTGWEKRGAGAVWIRQGVVAEGTGGFATDRRINLFRGDAEGAMADVRGLDMLVIADGPDDCTGNFLVSRIEEDGALRLRRRVPEEAQGLAFTVTRSSGCGVVPGECAIQASGDSFWQTVVAGAASGRYRLGFFYRAYDPPNMKPKGGPGEVAEVQVCLGPASTIAGTRPLECSYQWQRGTLEFALPGGGTLHIQARAMSDTPVEFTGFSLAQM